LGPHPRCPIRVTFATSLIYIRIRVGARAG
jgi:hypothetical protein